MKQQNDEKLLMLGNSQSAIKMLQTIEVIIAPVVNVLANKNTKYKLVRVCFGSAFVLELCHIPPQPVCLLKHFVDHVFASGEHLGCVKWPGFEN